MMMVFVDSDEDFDDEEDGINCSVLSWPVRFAFGVTFEDERARALIINVNEIATSEKAKMTIN